MLSFREVLLSDAQMILNWRLDESLSKFMLSDIDDDINIQKEWVSSCYNRPDYYHWIIEYQNKPVGLISFSQYSIVDKSCYFGFYIAESSARGIGGIVPLYFYNFAFNKLNIDCVRVEVAYFNTSVIDLHLLHGYDFEPEKDRIVVKVDKSILFIGMKLNREKFNLKRFSRCKFLFPIEKWKAINKSEKILGSY